MYPLKNLFLRNRKSEKPGEHREVCISGHFWQDRVNSAPFSSDEPNSFKSSPFLERLTQNESVPLCVMRLQLEKDYFCCATWWKTVETIPIFLTLSTDHYNYQRKTLHCVLVSLRGEHSGFLGQ